MSWQRNDLTVNGVRLEAVHCPPRDPSYPSLVFLHEGLGCVAMWRDFPRLLCELSGCGGLVYSRQGYGSSDPCTLPRPLSYMHKEALEVLPAVLAESDIVEHIVIGHSDGASIGLIHAANPTRSGLRGLISMAPHVICEEVSVQSIRKTSEAYLAGTLKAGLPKHHGANTPCAFWGWNKAWLDPEFRDWNITQYLPEISVPQLVIQGQDDEYGTLAQVDIISAHSGASVRPVILENCGHNPCREQTTLCLEITSDFINSLL